jgi:hypothetical protein
MAMETGVRGIVDWMAIGARCPFMIGAISTAATRMSKVRGPVAGGMALGAVCTHAGVGGRQGVTGNAGC